MASSVFTDYEQELRRRLHGVRLVLEIGLDEATVATVASHVTKLTPHFGDPIATYRDKLPATLVTYLVSLGVNKYDGSLWPHQTVAGLEPSKLGAAFESALKRLRLETFPDFGDDGGFLRFVAPILAHGGIPRFSARDYLRLVISEVQRNPGLRADDLVATWRTHRTVFNGIDTPVRRFLIYGGEVALDFLDRTIDMVSLAPAALDTAPSGLPAHIVEVYRAWPDHKGVAQSPARTGAALPRPRVRFDPWAGTGPTAELPAVGRRFGSGAWRVSGGRSTRVLTASLTDQQTAALDPAQDWAIEFDGGDGSIRTYDFEVLRDSAVICFDPADGQYVPDARPLSLTSVWTLSPADVTLTAVGADNVKGELRLEAELPQPSGTWSGFVARQYSLVGVRAIQVQGKSSDALVRVIQPASRPALDGSPLDDVLGEAGEPVYSGVPLLRVPQIPGFDDERWSLRLTTDSGTQVLSVSALPRAGDVVSLPLPADRFMGRVELALRGPLGSDLRASFIVVPGLALATPDHILLPGDGRPAAVVLAATGISFAGKPAGERVTVPIGGAGTELAVIAEAGPTSVGLRVQLPRLQWAVRRGDAVAALHSTSMHLSRADVESGAAEAIVVSTNRSDTPVELQLWSESLLQTSGRIITSRSGGRWSFSLDAFRSRVRADVSPGMTLRLVVDGRSVQIAALVSDVAAQGIVAVPAPDTDRTIISWTQGREMRNRVVHIWSLDRPWSQPVTVGVEDGAEPSVDVGPGVAPPGRYRVEVAVDDGWGSPSRPQHSSAGVADVHLGTTEAALARNRVLGEGTGEDLLELAMTLQAEPAGLWQRYDPGLSALAFRGLVMVLADESDQPGRGARILARIAAASPEQYVFGMAQHLEDESLDREGALRLFLVTLAEHPDLGSASASGRVMRTLWQGCSPLAAFVDIAAAGEGDIEAADRLEQHLGWRPGQDVPQRRGVQQNELGVPVAQLRWAKASVGLVPREVLTDDTWALATFEWMIAQQEAGEIGGTWWRRNRWLADELAEGCESAIPWLTSRAGPANHPDRWASLPKATLAAAIHATRGTEIARPAAIALCEAASLGAWRLVVHDLCAARALVRPLPGRVAGALGEHGDPRDLQALATGSLAPGAVVTGVVVSVTEEGVFVDVGRPPDAFMLRGEFGRREDGTPNEPGIGSEVTALVVAADLASGKCRLSVRALLARERLAALTAGEVVSGTVTGSSGSGYFVDLGYISAFLPATAALDVGDSVQAFVGATDPDRGLLRLTTKDIAGVLEAVRAMSPGDELACVVQESTPIGLFVSSGLIEGFLASSQLPRAGVGSSPSDYKAGDVLNATALRVDVDRGRVTFTLRPSEQKAFEAERERLTLGERRQVIVVGHATYGVFVETAGISGLVHRSELSWIRDTDPATFPLGSSHEAVVIAIDDEHWRLSLSIRQCTPDPRVSTMERMERGQEIQGVITRIVNFGAFVAIDEYLSGLLHVSELKEPVSEDEEPAVTIARQVDIGQELVFRVTAVDVESRRLGLTLRSPHPWLDGVGLPSIGDVLNGQVGKAGQVALPNRLFGVLSGDADRPVPDGDASGGYRVIGLDHDRRLVLLEEA